MPLSLHPAFVEFILLGPAHDRRQLQDSPILGDVWVEFAKAPVELRELLITPHREHAAGAVASAIDERIPRAAGEPAADIAPIHGIIAAPDSRSGRCSRS
jgi:serine protease AprX